MGTDGQTAGTVVTGIAVLVSLGATGCVTNAGPGAADNLEPDAPSAPAGSAAGSQPGTPPTPMPSASGDGVCVADEGVLDPSIVAGAVLVEIANPVLDRTFENDRSGACGIAYDTYVVDVVAVHSGDDEGLVPAAGQLDFYHPRWADDAPLLDGVSTEGATFVLVRSALVEGLDVARLEETYGSTRVVDWAFVAGSDPVTPAAVPRGLSIDVKVVEVIGDGLAFFEELTGVPPRGDDVGEIVGVLVDAWNDPDSGLAEAYADSMAAR